MSKAFNLDRIRSLRAPPWVSNQENAWEALCPDIFALILKAVQDNAKHDPGEARRVVALAGVCRRWRFLNQQLYSSPLSEMGLLQFPFALRQPGPSQRPVRCLLKRRGDVFILFQQNINEKGNGKLDFLIAARREWKARGSCFSVSASHTNFSKSGHAYMGKLCSNFWGTSFGLWEATRSPQKRKKPAVKVSFTETLQQGMRQRSISCRIYNVPEGRWSQGCRICTQDSTGSQYGSRAMVLRRKPPNLFGCLRLPILAVTQHHSAGSKHPTPSTFLRSYSSLRRSHYTFLDRNDPKACRSPVSVAGDWAREWSDNPSVIEMESKTPQWDEQNKCWCLNFNGRALLASHYNFQLIQSSTNNDSDSHLQDDASENEIISLQLGKVGRGLYAVDYCHPLSAFVAFSICLSSFATRVGLDP